MRALVLGAGPIGLLHLETGEFHADAIVTHSFGLDDVADAYQAVRDRLGVKVAVLP